jgi:hypothetical protein
MAAVPRRAFAPLVLALAAGLAPSQEPRDLLKYVPSPVNTVAVVNVGQILKSPRAEKGGWSKLPHTEYLAGAVPVNPAVERMLLATEFIPDRPGHGGGLAVASINRPLDLDALAKSFGGEVVSAGGEKVVDTPDGRFFVPLKPQILGAMRTDNKQDVTRWMRYAKEADKSLVSPYLLRSVVNFGTRFHILVAVDTEDLFHPDQLKAAVAKSKVPEAGPPAADEVERFIAGVNGVRFTASVTDAGIDATIRVDSTYRTDNVPADLVKGFVIETLARQGAELADLGAARARAEGLTVILSFNVSDGELAKIMSLFVTAAAGISQGDVIPVAPGGVNADATRAYFRAVNRTLDDLRGRPRPGLDYNKVAVWFDTAANRIATLSVLNVDPIALKYGQGAAGRLQAMAASLRGVPLKTQQLESRTYAYRFGGWGWFGGGGTYTNIPQVGMQIRDTIDADEADRAKLWAEIDADRVKARQQLAEKYGADFDAAR